MESKWLQIELEFVVSDSTDWVYTIWNGSCLHYSLAEQQPKPNLIEKNQQRLANSNGPLDWNSPRRPVIAFAKRFQSFNLITESGSQNKSAPEINN